MRPLLDAIWYNGGKGPGEYGNPYWKRYTIPHAVWVGLTVTLLGIAIGLESLFICSAYLQFLDWEMFLSYLNEPLILTLNLLPCVLLMYLFSFATGRVWAGFGLTAVTVFVLSLVNYYKIRIRSEALLVSDLVLAGEAAGILGRYTIEITGRALSAGVALAAGLLFSCLLVRGTLKKPLVRLVGTALSAAVLVGLVATVYLDDGLYNRTKNTSVDYNPWSDLSIFVSKGFVYPFLHSAGTAFPFRPAGYSEAAAEAILARYAEADIPQERKINLIAVMLEAYTDLSEYPQLGVDEAVYAPLHRLYAESLHGHLNVNIFGGGTVNTERCFLTGHLLNEEYRIPTNSHVWALRAQGYTCEGYHPGDSWFYDRQNVQRNLGFGRYYFLGDFGTDTRWDNSFFPLLAKLYAGRDKSAPYFNFSVTYQNHGAYASTYTADTAYLTGAGLSEPAYNILNNYLSGIADTSQRLWDFVDALRDDPEPVAVLFFGDHMPWLGDGNFILAEAGIDADFAHEAGFYTYYNTPYLLWANEAAKAVTGGDFTGEGPRISPGYMMNLIARECGWTGSGWLQYNDSVLDAMPIANTGAHIYRIDGALYTEAMLEGDAAQLVREHQFAEYYRKHHFAYRTLVE